MEQRVGKFILSKISTSEPKSRAVIFGWVGCQDKHLMKYAQLIQNLGVDEVWRTTAKTVDVFLRPTNLRALFQEAFFEMKKQPHIPTYFYYFSNGGAFVHDQFVSLRQENKDYYNELKIAGIIFDSCPAYMYSNAGARALSESIRNFIVRKITFGFAYMALVTLTYLYYALSGFKRFRPSEFFQNLLQDDIQAPVLYIYSSDDQLTDCYQLSQLIQKRKLAALVPYIDELYITKPSVHVGHFVKHSDLYTSTLKSFIEKTRK